MTDVAMRAMRCVRRGAFWPTVDLVGISTGISRDFQCGRFC